MTLHTRAEATAYRETSLHRDVLAFLHELDRRGDPRLRLRSFGTSGEGRDLPLVVAGPPGIDSPATAAASGLPVVLVIGGIHAGEVEGKEALLMLLRDLLAGRDEGLLERMVLLVAPLYNPDGNDRLDPANRRLDVAHCEGQDGPAAVGTRVNAAGINLNRDYLRQDAVESRCLADLWLAWQPHLTVDCHSTDGSVHGYALTYDVPHTVASGRPEPIALVRDQLLPAVRSALRAGPGLETWFYGNFVSDEGGGSEGWITYTHHPRFGSNYRGLTGRADILAEAYSYLPFAERVRTSYEFVAEVLRAAAGLGDALRTAVAAAATPLPRIAVRYRLEAYPEPVEILAREPRTLAGTPTTVRVPYHGRFVPEVSVERPWAYAVPAALAPRFRGHGLAVEPISGHIEARVEVARVLDVHQAGSRRILEASDGERALQVETATARRQIGPELSLVRTDQPQGAVAVYLCEPESDDGVIECGWIALPGAGEEFPILRVIEPWS